MIAVVRPSEAREERSSNALRASVIVCTHNGGSLIEKTIESLVDQDLPSPPSRSSSSTMPRAMPRPRSSR